MIFVRHFAGKTPYYRTQDKETEDMTENKIETPKKKYQKHDRSQARLEQFVKAWQAAGSVEEALKALGVDHAELYRLRGVCVKLGIELKRMPRGRKAAAIDVEALKALAAGK